MRALVFALLMIPATAISADPRWDNAPLDYARELERLKALKLNERAAACNKNPRSTDPFCEARRRAQAELRKMTPPTNYPACSVWVDSVAKHEPIIVNGEHVGYTPKLVDLEFLQFGKDFDGTCYAGTYSGGSGYFKKGDFSSSHVTIKVLPREYGCVQSEILGRGIPRKMLFDTRLCDTRSRVDVNVLDLR